jgi:hypothetical protein
MGRRVVSVESRAVLFSGDEQPPLGDRFWAVTRARVIDELTGAPPTSALTLTTITPGLTPRITPDGLCGVTGIPSNVFPRLALQNYGVRMVIGAAGYVARERDIQVPQTPGFPTLFQSPPLVDIPLHREPTVIHGRTVRATGTTTSPLTGAIVSITGIWRTPPSATASVPASPANIVSLAPPLYADRAAVTGRLRRRNMLPVLGDDKSLLTAVSAGTDRIAISNWQNLAVNDIVLIDALSPDAVEYLAITAIDAVSSPDQPARMTVAHPVRYPHRRGAIVREGTPQPFGVVRTFADAAQRGDTCVFVNGLSGLTSADVVQVFGGPVEEYHQVRLFRVTSDAEGYYRLPPLSRVAQVEVRAEHGALTPVRKEFRPDYASRENRLDFIFR